MSDGQLKGPAVAWVTAETIQTQTATVWPDETNWQELAEKLADQLILIERENIALREALANPTK